MINDDIKQRYIESYVCKLVVDDLLILENIHLPIYLGRSDKYNFSRGFENENMSLYIHLETWRICI